jgi:hypothetical protein
MSRIRSYTVIELLVVMIISSLSIGITYTCYTIFSGHYLSFKKRSDELANYILLDKLLTKDISASKKVGKTSDGINCVLQKKNIQYEFYDTYILRKDLIVDTFPILTAETPVFKRFGKTENIPGALIEEISMEVLYKDEKLYFYYRKKYGADMLMSMEEADKQ